ncbi:hypothetical protein C6A85_14245, partial [Mycobacterium sp. ITM-2017-0098]
MPDPEPIREDLAEVLRRRALTEDAAHPLRGDREPSVFDEGTGIDEIVQVFARGAVLRLHGDGGHA